MKRSLYTYFFIAWLLFGLACFGVVSLLSSRISYRLNLDNTASRMYSQARHISNDYSEVYTEKQIPSDLRTRLEGLDHFADEMIWFVSPDGTISFDSGNEKTGMVIEGFDPADSKSFYRIGHFYGCFEENMLSVQTPITANMTIYGYVIMHHALDEVAAESDRMLAPLYITVSIVFALSLLILLLIHRLVMVPLSKITRAAEEYASGNLKHTISVRSGTEIRTLADTMNVMTDELAALEDHQKRFIANVSHDFRSPLTSIKGYLQAIIDGVISPEDEEKYIRVVIHETERLENLTQSMLSLDSLERKNIHLEYSDFNICSLIRSACETLEGKCILKNITFDLILSSSAVYVHADLGKIQQVLHNLLDNAIKFSDRDSVITITVRQVRNRVLVSVKDTGVGISPGDLKQIWDRFFKSDQSRGRDKTGTGLGLSIVKEIITAHGETIDVISTEGAGTEFTFRLAAAKEEPGGILS